MVLCVYGMRWEEDIFLVRRYKGRSSVGGLTDLVALGGDLLVVDDWLRTDCRQ